MKVDYQIKIATLKCTACNGKFKVEAGSYGLCPLCKGAYYDWNWENGMPYFITTSESIDDVRAKEQQEMKQLRKYAVFTMVLLVVIGLGMAAIAYFNVADKIGNPPKETIIQNNNSKQK